MATFQLEIVTPHRIVYSGDVSLVHAPGIEGEFEVLPHHQRMMITLAFGEVAITESDGSLCELVITKGFATISGDHMTVLADKAETAEEIDMARALAARDRASARIAKREHVDFARAEAALTRALWRLRVGHALNQEPGSHR